MPHLKAEEAREFIELRAKSHGLEVTRVDIVEADLGAGLANLNLYFRESPQAYPAMEPMRRELSAQSGEDVRAGYYQHDADSDDEDISEGEAMMQFDCFFATFAKDPETMK